MKSTHKNEKDLLLNCEHTCEFCKYFHIEEDDTEGVCSENNDNCIMVSYSTCDKFICNEYSEA